MKLPKLLKHLIRKGEIGQTIVIMAFGVIILLGFVGLVTDVSLLYVRFSTLKRAVDAGAVSAAGQVRRLVPNDEEWDKAVIMSPGNPDEQESLANGFAFARNIASVSLAARQFIEFYGLDPTLVLVDTCATRPGDIQLCTADQRKLIRVTAQIESPTVFLRLLGWPSVTLETSTVSETASLDVAVVLDVSESMLNETSYEDWEDAGYPVRYIPPRISQNGTLNSHNNLQTIQGIPDVYLWPQLLNTTQATINANPALYPVQAFIPGVGAVNDPNDPRHARPDCRVKFFPSANFFEIPRVVIDEYSAFLGKQYPHTHNPTVKPGPTWDGFIPTYNFYGCCNDPDGVNGFDDLICQPFKDARDATEGFLQRVDFLRGDRVAFVTFDRGAYLLYPPGVDRTGTNHMIQTEADALVTLRTSVGVRAEPNFYAEDDNDGIWDDYVTGGQRINYDDGENEWVDGWNDTRLGLLIDYPVKDNCPFQNAGLFSPLSLYSSPTDPAHADYNPFWLYNPLTNRSSAQPIMHPNLNDPGWEALLPASMRTGFGQWQKALFTYEYRASCAGTNIGAALREGNNALINAQREEGVVWVMVFLSDGAAGASDPVRIGNVIPPKANPYAGVGPISSRQPTAGGYGAFGLCPYGAPGSPGELISAASDPTDTGFPFCSDEAPESRELLCFDPTLLDADGKQYVDLGGPLTSCYQKYDVDDYARDWADFVGMSLKDGFPGLAPADAGEEQKPTIFTIGFGLTFPLGDGSCDANVADCLGEELLRYIADVGDNNRLDIDHQQAMKAGGIANVTDWGPRGACEEELPAPPSTLPFDQLIAPMPPTENCGNYYNAPTGAELELVFDEIASRMFTRLAPQ